MITAINCSILESPSNSDDDDMNTCVYKSTNSGSTIKCLMKETRVGRRVARNLVGRGHSLRAKIPLICFKSEINERLIKI